MPRSKSPANAKLSWSDDPDIESASFERIATLAISHEVWQSFGARFIDTEDPIGGVSRIAVGQVKTGDSTIEFGVLDHGEPTTFLLGDGAVADVVLPALVDAGIDPAAIIELLPADPPASIDERVLGLERFQQTIEALLAERRDRGRITSTVVHAPIGLSFHPEGDDRLSGMTILGITGGLGEADELRLQLSERNRLFHLGGAIWQERAPTGERIEEDGAPERSGVGGRRSGKRRGGRRR
jgi:hypothetical protein